MIDFFYQYPLLWEWLSFFLRFLHVITAIAWIGSSFYFIALDLGLRQAPNLPADAHGEEWQVHGGGFYHIQKYLVAPKALPDHLTWFKWESYATGMSGIALLVVVYYIGAEFYLIDPEIMELEPYQAILLSIGSILIGYIIYDLLCRSPLGNNNNRLMIVLFFLLVAVSHFYAHVFSGRAAMLHIGAFTAIIMVNNVFYTIIPNQKKVIASLKKGEIVDPALGKIAKQRSTHNNYLTLPVLFLMLSNHYPLSFSGQFNWLIASIVFLIGVLIRHFFNSKHARKGEPYWCFILASILFAIIIWLSSFSIVKADTAQDTLMNKAVVSDEMVGEIVMGRCSMCHAKEPLWDGIIMPPKGIILESIEDIKRYQSLIYIQAGRTHAMPPSNLTYMEKEEREAIRIWYENLW